MKSHQLLFLIPLLLSCSSTLLFAQDFVSNEQLIQSFLEENTPLLETNLQDLKDWIITDEYTSKHNKVTHVYIQQRHQGIEIYNAVANFNIKDQKIVSMGNRLEAHLNERVTTTIPTLSPIRAIQVAAEHLKLTITTPFKLKETITPSQEFVYSNGGIALQDIIVKITYQAMEEGSIKLAWNVTIYQKNAKHWWNVRVDALTGSILDKNDWVIQCNKQGQEHQHCSHPPNLAAPAKSSIISTASLAALPPTSQSYTVFATPLNSPIDGIRTVETNPYDPVASPNGWHNDGAISPHYYITRGNNVYAYEDTAGANVPGHAPYGPSGFSLAFNYPIPTPVTHPHQHLDASITNLFYWNNLLHDILYHYGFDEVSGNFQASNWGNGGLANDPVLAEAQDGGGANNANITVPPDGQSPRMQMYNWIKEEGASNALRVHAPYQSATPLPVARMKFSPLLPPNSSIWGSNTTPIVGDLVVPTSNWGHLNGCNSINNTADMAGKIVLFDAGGACSHFYRALDAQFYGALAVIFVADTPGDTVFTLDDPAAVSGVLNIPVVMISNNTGNFWASNIAYFNATYTISLFGEGDTDSDLASDVIVHEYTHGLSVRLAGGPNNSNCLSNWEQMGEGWSDFIGLMLTMDSSDLATDPRGLATYLTGQAETSQGIRWAPYTTDTSLNAFTYGDIGSKGINPHYIGSIWGTMLWDLNWAFIDHYGFDANLHTGTGGNNKCLQLVVDAIKLQPCSPGFVEARDAILLADQLLYNGANQCLIWKAFAKRGLGYSANQGSPFWYNDQLEAFDLPPSCRSVVPLPIAAFHQHYTSTCQSTIHFRDSSQNEPTQWLWDFDDGHTDTTQHPVHTFDNNRTYAVQLIVWNSMGADTLVKNITINTLTPPSFSDTVICYGTTVDFPYSGNDTLIWYDSTGTVLLDTTNNFSTPVLVANQQYQVEKARFFPSQYIGMDSTWRGWGGYNYPNYLSIQNFRAYEAFNLVSAWVDAATAGTYTLYVWNDFHARGAVVDSITFTIPAGKQRVPINLEVLPGTYSMGASNVGLRRVNQATNAHYPYVIPGLLSIHSTRVDSLSVPEWSYLFDWEVQRVACHSKKVPVKVQVVEPSFSTSQSGLTVNFTDQSIGATSWFWNFGDGNTSTLQHPSHTYNVPDSFTVTLVVNGQTTCVDSVIVDIKAISISYYNTEALQAVLQPNPATSTTNLVFNKATPTALILQLLHIDGRVLKTVSIPPNTLLQALDLTTLPVAPYIIRLKGASFSKHFKLIKTDQ